MQMPAVLLGPLAFAEGGLGGSGSVLGSGGTVSHSLPLTSNSASLDLDRERERQKGRAGGMWECEGGEKRKKQSVKVGSFGVVLLFFSPVLLGFCFSRRITGRGELRE